MNFNEIFLFPFEKIKKDSDIIIYGMGNVGKCFYNQITSIKYCNIIATADKAANGYKEFRYNVIRPEQIQDYIYDYIVIAVASAGSARKIQNELTSIYNVPKEKIIFTPNRKVQVCLSNTDLTNWLNSVDVMKNELRVFWLTRVGNVNYFANIVECIHKLKAEHEEKKIEEIKRYFKDYLYTDDSVKNKIVILRIMYMSDCFDAELMELFVKCIFQLDNYESRIWMVYDLSIIEGNEQNCRYQNYYIDKRKLMDENVSHYYNMEVDSKKKSDNNRIAIVSFTLGNERSSHNALIVPYANEMARQGREVTIFPMDLLRYRYGECFIQPLVPLEQIAENFEWIHEELFIPCVKIVYNQGESIKERICNLINCLIEYNPYVVYDFCGEYSFLSPIICQRFYTVALPIRGYASSACFDVYMCRDKQICMKENEYYHSIDTEKMVEALVCTYPQQSKEKYKRQDFNIDKNAFVITTVGERLRKEVTAEFVDCVCVFLKEHEDACWILVGEKINNYIYEYYYELLQNEQIIEWGFEKNLQEFYAICDIYWNPNRMGAGGSIVTAMRCGLPIVTTDTPSDVLPRLGVENTINGDYNDCRKYVEELYNNRKLYKEKSQLMQERMKISSVKEYVGKLLEVGEEGKNNLCL